MRTGKADELLAAANPIPDVNQLESEAFSIDDVLDRLDDAPVLLARPRTIRQGRGRSLAAAATAFALVIAIGAATTLVLRGDGSTVSGGTACLDGRQR